MTRDEAVRLLGLERPDPDPDDLRRAYLRRVKTTKPEADPEGFARLRQAYELLKGTPPLPVDWAAASPFRDEAPAPPAAPFGGERAAPRPAPPPPAPGAAESPANDPFEPYRRRLSGRPFPEQLEIAREAVAALPDCNEARWLLLSFLTDPTSTEAVRVLSDGAAREPEEFLDELLWRFPDRVAPEIVQAARKGAAFARLLLIADSHAEQGRPIEALDALRAALAAAGDLSSTPPALRLALRPVFSLHARAHADAAQMALGLIRQHAGSGVLDVRRTDHETAIAFTIADELARLGPSLPLDLRQVAARAAKSGDFDTTPYEARFAARLMSSGAVRKWRKRLRRDAPTLAGLFALDLGEDQLRPQGTPRLRPAFGIPLIPVVYLLGRLLFGVISGDDDAHTHRAGAFPPVTASRGLLVQTMVKGACDGASDTQPCRDLLGVAAELARDPPACASLRMRMQLIRSSSLREPPQVVQQARQQLEAMLNSRCPGP